MTPNMFVGIAMVLLTIALAVISAVLHLRTNGKAGFGWAVLAFLNFIFTVGHLGEMVTYE